MSSTHPDQKESVHSREARLCANNCGFFANPAHRGYCSKCYRDLVETSEEAKKVAVVEPAAAVKATTSTAAAAFTMPCAAPARVLAGPSRPAKKKCGVCGKKLGLTGFSCKCGLEFCGKHRYAESHPCDFDHKSSERQRLAEDNPLVQGTKLERL